MDHSRLLFRYFRLFFHSVGSTQPHLKRRSLVSEATALPSAPQRLPGLASQILSLNFGEMEFSRICCLQKNEKTISFDFCHFSGKRKMIIIQNWSHKIRKREDTIGRRESSSVTGKKLPNVYKIGPKMISLEK